MTRSNEADMYNNPWLVGGALDDYHRSMDVHNQLIEQIRPILDSYDKESVLKLYKAARHQVELEDGWF